MRERERECTVHISGSNVLSIVSIVYCFSSDVVVEEQLQKADSVCG